MTTSHTSPASDIGGGTLVVAVAWLVFYLVAIRGGTVHNETRNDDTRQYMVSRDISWNNQDTTTLPVPKLHDMTFVFSDEDDDLIPTKSSPSERTVSSVGPIKRTAELQEER